MILQNLITNRLTLIPVTLEIIESLLDKDNSIFQRLGIVLDDSWPRDDTMDILPIVHKTLSRYRVPSGFEFWMIIKNNTMNIIGDIGFHGKPNEQGEVEIGFGLVEHEQGKGYGFEALQAIIKWVYTQKTVKVVKANCLINNKPSARILEKVGMKEDYRSEDLIYWKLII